MIRLRGTSSTSMKMEMIFHQCIGIKVEGVSVLIVREIGKESLPIFFVKKDPLSSIPSGDDMIQCSWEMDPRLTGHSICLSNSDVHVNTELPKPDPNLLFTLASTRLLSPKIFSDC